MGFVQDQLRKTSVESAVAADALDQNKAVIAENTAIRAANLLPGVNKPLLPLIVSDEAEKNRVAILKKMGFTNGEQVAYFGAEIDSNPQLKTFFEGFEKDFARTNKYDAVLAKMGKQILVDGQKIGFDKEKAEAKGTGIIDKLSADLKGNGAQITKQLKDKPDLFADKLDGYATGKIDIVAFLAEATVTAPAPSKPAPETPTAAPIRKPQGAAPTTPAAPAPVAAPVAAQAAEITTPTTSAPAPATSTSSFSSAEDEFAEGLLSTLASASDSDMKAKIGKDEAKIIAGGLASKAIALGVSASTANGFKDTIKKDDKLASAIAQNLQNNPEFVRQLARMAKDNSTLPEPIKSRAQQEMGELMANPEKLASDDYVKTLQRQIQMAESMKKFDIAGMFGGLMGPLKGGMRDMGLIASGFSGLLPVLSMSKGSSFLPDILINVRNFEANKDAAMAFSHYGPEDMTALGKPGADGKYFHTVVTKNAQGQDVKKSVPNGQITIKDASGNDVNVIPSVGVLMAKQEKGKLDGNGNFVPGNIRVPVIKGVDELGNANSLSLVVMTPAEFAKYKDIADAAAREKGGSIKQLAFEPYTAEDFAEAQRKADPIRMARVEPATGTVMAISANPNLLRDSGPATTRHASNDRDLTLQG